MNNVNIAKVVQERLPYIDLDATVIGQNIKDDKITIELSIEADTYKYTVQKAGKLKREFTSNFIDYQIICKLEDFFNDLKARIFNEKVQPGQTTIFDAGANQEADEPKRIEVVNGPDQLEEEKEFAEEISEEVIEAEFSEKQDIITADFTPKASLEVGTEGEIKKDDSSITEDNKEATQALNDEKPKDDNPLMKHCEKCGEYTMDLDVNNECPTCAAQDASQAFTDNNGFGQAITASF